MTDPKPQRSALGDALRNTIATAATDAIATKLGGATHHAPTEHGTAAPVEIDPPPGPDTLTRDDIATKLGSATHHAPEAHTHAVDANGDEVIPGPDTLTREDIDTALGCLDAIAEALETIASAVQLAMEAANKPAPPTQRPRPTPR